MRLVREPYRRIRKTSGYAGGYFLLALRRYHAAEITPLSVYRPKISALLISTAACPVVSR
ncbi:hypothetical protein SeHB_A1691 [Salmonella enterica subsp. enterica serovar Heidelberg str. SL486]|nr:hypothetical protein SeHB_A1691 [Salmonella enterica subsp. enterica serovar Heidelberg str. SL486]